MASGNNENDVPGASTTELKETKAKSDGKNKEDQKGDEDEGAVELIRRYLAEKLGFYSESVPDSETKPASEQILDELSLDGIVKYIQDGNCKKIITLAGAGISTSAGIPDFRSPGSGLYSNLEKYNLPDPQAIFEINFFRSNPQPFFTLAKELFPGSFKPTPCHYFIKLLHSKGLLLRHYSQNIDTLERVADLPGDCIVEAHGTFHTSHCLDCNAEYTLEWMKEQIFSDAVPTCSQCNGVVKPDIVFFGESLPSRFFTCSKKDFIEADLLIIMGSSLAVQPFASLIDRVKETCPRLLINREKAGQQDRLMRLLGMGSGMDFDSSDNKRDVAWLGDCDDGCKLLAEKLGWLDELNELIKKGHEKVDAENSKSNINVLTKKESSSPGASTLQTDKKTKSSEGSKIV